MRGHYLKETLTHALLDLEERGDIVLATSTPELPVKLIQGAINSLVPSEAVSLDELAALRALVLHAIDDERFFDSEMPTLTGLTAAQFAELAKKLPKG